MKSIQTTEIMWSVQDVKTKDGILTTGWYRTEKKATEMVRNFPWQDKPRNLLMIKRTIITIIEPTPFEL
jgi:hypothetical protein